MSQDVEITWNGPAAVKAARGGAVRGLRAAVDFILGEAIKIVPLDEGTLQDSGKATVDEAELVGIVSFDTKYAVKQHEDLTLHHANGRQAKYLEQPWRENDAKIQEIIGTHVRQALG